MKILFIASTHNPFNPTQGASQRSSLLLQACTAIADVDVISFCTENEPSTDKYNIIYQSVVHTHSSQNRFAKFRCLLSPWKPESVFGLDAYKKEIIDAYVSKKHYDYIVIRYMPEAVQCGLLQYADKLVIDIDDHPVDRALNTKELVSSWRNKLYYRLLAKSIHISFKKVISHIKVAFFTNKDQVSNPNSFFLPNVPYYELEAYEPFNKEIPKRLLFVGDLSYPPNMHGIYHFIKNVYPHVLKHIPDLTINIVGKIYDNELIEFLTSELGVSVKGFVPSLVEEYEQCVAAVIPIYTGAGTCIKVLEAMQMQKVCVTTPVGFRGYNGIFTPGEDILIANSDTEFASQIIKVLSNEIFRRNIVKRALSKQNKYYSREQFFITINDILQEK